jgi:DNA invertase Pin-like site-specific DNA recombinase
MTRIGYARVSSRSQDLLVQEARLTADGCDPIFTDKASGIRAERPGWDDLVASLQEGDVLVACKLDRIARSLGNLLGITEMLTEARVDLVILDQPEVDTTSSIGRLVFRILGAVAEFERDLILERTAEGRIEAMAAGVQFGRPRVMDAASTARARELHRSGLTMAEVASVIGVSRMTVVRYLDRED